MDPQNEPGTDPQNDPNNDPTPPVDPEPNKDPKPDTDPEPGKGLVNKHGQPAVSQSKYEADTKKLQEQIDDLTSKLNDHADTKKERDELRGQIKDVQEQLKLTAAGALPEKEKDIKALMPVYDNDIEALKEAHPSMFKDTKPVVSSGGAPGGTPSSQEADSIEEATSNYYK